MTNKKILFIASHRKDRSPGQRYRFEQYFDFLQQNGYDCELAFFLTEADDSVFYSPGNILKKFFITIRSAKKRMRDVRRASQFDIVFIQREAFMTGSTFFEKGFRRSSAKIVFDFDDSIWLLDTSNANRMWQWMKSARKTSQLIALSDQVFAGNRYLADYANRFNKNVKIIPTTIDTTIFHRKYEYENKSTVCIGWSGSHTTIKHFEAAIPVLKKLKDKYGERICFKVMGDPHYENKVLGIAGIPWSSATEVAVISSFDIGIMPLPDDQWVKGKCGLKGLSYMALEVPTVMSAIGVNPEIINDGVSGFLATTEEEWVNKISQLIESFELRKKMGISGRETIVSRYSVESQKNNYLNTFNELLKR
jgi:glycosyltransferase involved in cell wall biosynthesis